MFCGLVKLISKHVCSKNPADIRFDALRESITSSKASPELSAGFTAFAFGRRLYFSACCFFRCLSGCCLLCCFFWCCLLYCFFRSCFFYCFLSSPFSRF